MGILDERVAVITGAGAGLGREHALLLAAEGAKVVCNDLRDAKLTADEIVAAGGQAVAVDGSVTDMAVGQQLTEAAVDTFGDLHIVVNNAGFIRDAMLWNMTEEAFDAVIGVHLKGAFSVTQPAARYWRDHAKAGVHDDRALIMTSSGSGLHGNPGQWNYSAAKAGLAIQTVVAGRELERFGVRANAIAPVARTEPVLATPGIGAMVGEPADDNVFDRYNPANVAPLVAYLASDQCPFTGQLFGVYGGYVGLYRGYTVAHELRADRQWTAAELAVEMGSDDFPKSVNVARTPLPKIDGATK